MLRRLPAHCLTLILPALALAVADVAAAADGTRPAGPVPRKLIQVGWDKPTPSQLLRNLQARERLPFDGMSVRIIGVDDDGAPVRLRDAGHARPWKRAWFQAQVDTLRQIRSATLTDLFVYVDLSPAPSEFVDAFDDAGWEQIAKHLEIAAWVAREGGLKGIMFDPEAYRGSIVRYADRRQPDKTFAQYEAKVRERGRQVMTAMASEYPDMTFFTLFMHSGIAMAAFGLDPHDGLQDNRYSLYPAFINGWLEAVPPTLRIVDGFEMAYPHSSELQYLKHANAMRNASLALVDPALRPVYRAQVQTGLAIYLDAYVKYPRADVHADVRTDPPLTGPVTERLSAAVMSAFEVVDEYVWVYCESAKWFPESPHARGAIHTWEDMLPGVTEALRRATVPEERARLRAEKEFQIRRRKAALRGVPMRSLARNGDFANGEPPTQWPAADRQVTPPDLARDPVQDWTTWSSGGQPTLARAVAGSGGFGSAYVAGAADGGYTQAIAASPFRFYKVIGRLRSAGAGQATIELRWLDGEGSALPAPPATLQRDDDGPGWRQVSAIVRAPAEAAQLEVRLRAHGQESARDAAWFDDIEVYRIGVN